MPTPTESTGPDLEALKSLRTAFENVQEQMHTTVVGQQQVFEQVLISIFAGGHAILEGVPGLAKTLLVHALADSLSLKFNRIQFTPDLMPADITGTEVIFEDKKSGAREFKFIEGPIFANLLLADEINRTPPKTQSALLEGMQERHVSSSGKRLALPQPFFVLATQNPIEQEGTYPLPEAQLDRFIMKILVRYPSADEEEQIYRMVTGVQQPKIKAVLKGDEVLHLQQLVRRVPISDLLVNYTRRLVCATRTGTENTPEIVKRLVLWGVGPRGGQSLILAAKARAALNGRPEVAAEDLQAVSKPVLRHRLVLNYNAEAEGQTPDSVIDQLLQEIPLHPSTSSEDARVQRVLAS